jgi:alginate O-acetyltransferase complex protein AlgJ
MLLVMLAGLVQAALALQSPRVQAVPHTALDLREGRSSDAFAKALDAALPARDGLIAAANALRYAALGGAGEQVRAGGEGWLYLAEELRFDADGAANQQQRVHLLGKAAAALKRADVELLVVLVPDKARVHPEHLPGGLPAWAKPRYAEALAALRAEGVNTVDLMAAFGPTRVSAAEPPGSAPGLSPALSPSTGPARGDRPASELYARTDTHWNQAGARLAAEAVAAQLAPLRASLRATRFASSTAPEEMQRPGDLLKLMGLAGWPGLPAAFRPPDDRERTVTTAAVPAASAAAAGLFDNPVPPVVLTGTSYSLRANFAGFLQEALQAEVLNTARDGGGFTDAAAAYFADDAFATAKPAVLVWELPERFLTLPLSGKDAPVLARLWAATLPPGALR